jgi:hypothetical protein
VVEADPSALALGDVIDESLFRDGRPVIRRVVELDKKLVAGQPVVRYVVLGRLRVFGLGWRRLEKLIFRLVFGSTTASNRFFTTICAIRSETVGIPNVLSPPLAFGIFTVRTGGGK